MRLKVRYTDHTSYYTMNTVRSYDNGVITGSRVDGYAFSRRRDQYVMAELYDQGHTLFEKEGTAK